MKSFDEILEEVIIAFELMSISTDYDIEEMEYYNEELDYDY